ncbi:MAG: proteasome subunit alpha, partial [Thermoplasmata archaeon]
SGAMMEYKATAEGEGRDVAIEFFEKNYNEGLKKEDAILLGIKAIEKVKKERVSEEEVGICVIDVNGFQMVKKIPKRK